MILAVSIKVLNPVRQWRDAVGNQGTAIDMVLAWQEEVINPDGSSGARENTTQATAFNEVATSVTSQGFAVGQLAEVDIVFKATARGQYVDNKTTIRSIKPYLP